MTVKQCLSRSTVDEKHTPTAWEGLLSLSKPGKTAYLLAEIRHHAGQIFHIQLIASVVEKVAASQIQVIISQNGVAQYAYDATSHAKTSRAIRNALSNST
eukprot:TRINITY_DN6458_c0_g1_i2.p3 TRINITY_DN6458_c0_g1~~TRINITY_DN6458_c0_g1_i2.p3  ORF type:complete len:100 (-),score=2.12 TRINITY_DN6458_c0_g1_i2:714-1013(-)